ncbi:hypothetical protein THAOC_36094 [Thalassiosira oceanica]|uniref:Uncharacterized protein n=1 Tax=Thalassiosira oceanica TaxID=159749 RepID=K0R2B6_THAOC|nr:hypothetical protein THAOC_36094 [Thalassiosira oceanica]|eukprot:EJK45299.1 hypothetical protein THAOC_36094 [Thalassiosira oceanica]
MIRVFFLRPGSLSRVRSLTTQIHNTFNIEGRSTSQAGASKDRTGRTGSRKDWHGSSSITNQRLGRGESGSKSEEWDSASH